MLENVHTIFQSDEQFTIVCRVLILFHKTLEIVAIPFI